MQEAWKYNRECKLLRDTLQSFSWNGRNLNYSFPQKCREVIMFGTCMINLELFSDEVRLVGVGLVLCYLPSCICIPGPFTCVPAFKWIMYCRLNIRKFLPHTWSVHQVIKEQHMLKWGKRIRCQEVHPNGLFSLEKSPSLKTRRLTKSAADW
jgi:hypothetical protein